MDEKEINIFVGNKIRELRLERGLTQKELAERIGMGDTTIANYEKGIRAPKRNKIFKIASVLGKSVDDFFPNNSKLSNITTITPSQPEITQIYNTLSQDSKSKLLKYAKLLQEADNIEYYEVTATTKLSAGLGYAFNEYDQERVYVANRPPRHDLASFVYGDSMEPKFQNGELVYLVDKGLSSYDGEICAVAYDGETFIKRVYTEAGKLRLVSLNPKYDDIVIDFPPADGEFIRIYEVVGSDTTVQI
ncbi:XRE family transcriptional regulator [Streptococcus uberis]|uniref:XRE family transcriptional regulator n=1 Tax=Streptococcus uberis TaxID=1349 RepID=UPI00215012D9|nr:XRE family transcriptional regulator [Streptococcus uberis]MCR4258303.1 XRE family transcriptional regulator [Streptococcus uberis]